MSIGQHDVASLSSGETVAPFDFTTKEQQDAIHHQWEAEVDALASCLFSKETLDVNEFRKNIEALPDYGVQQYYSRWAASVSQVLIRKGIISESEWRSAVGAEEDVVQEQLFQPGDVVYVKDYSYVSSFRKPHLRTPGYCFSQRGIVERVAGVFGNPERLAFANEEGEDRGKQPLYRVKFKQKDLWPEYSGSAEDTIVVEIYQSWLTKSAPNNIPKSAFHPAPSKYQHHHHHDDEDHDHGHVHEERAQIEQTAVDRELAVTREGRVMGEALVRLAIEKQLLTRAELVQRQTERDNYGISHGISPKVVARAWKNPQFKKALLDDGQKAVNDEFNLELETHLCVVENTEKIHNVIVCTLCSCYPISFLGRPPTWYKSSEYRSTVPRNPRKVLAGSFGTNLPENVEVRVHDSTADLRYIVLPCPPTNADLLSEEQCAALMTRDHLIGVTRLLKGASVDHYFL